MKKVFVIAAVAASLIGLTSCDKDTYKCWEVTAETTMAGVTVSATTYVWDTENHIDIYVEDTKKQVEALGGKFSATPKKASKYKNQVDCEAANLK